MKILITAGPTREYIDPVRFISNPSTGKMGYMIAEFAAAKGHTVVLISGPTSLRPPAGVECIYVEKTHEMLEEVLKHFPGTDCLVMAAAVSDWKPHTESSSKIKEKKSWQLKLIPNPDILKEVSKIKRENQKLIGFALETENLYCNAKEKLKEKKLDLIIANTTDFFGDGKRGRALIISGNGSMKEFKSVTKKTIAQKVVLYCEQTKQKQ